jgi:carboxyl-terminal processing protease
MDKNKKFKMTKEIKRDLLILVGVIILAIGFLIGLYSGYQRGIEKQLQPQRFIIQSSSVTEQEKPENVDFSIFWEAWKQIKDKYIDQNLNDKDLIYGAISGLVNSLGDPNTNFFPPTEAKKFQEDVQGSFGGVGIEISARDNQIVIVTPLKQSPAERAGLKADDKIIAINGTSTLGFTTDDAVNLIRGPEGTKVTLTVMRDGWPEPKDFTLTREIIQVPTLDWKMLDGGIAYIELYNFYQNVSRDFYQAATEIYSQNPKAIILDLRNNPGGYLESAIDIAGWFTEPGTIITSEQFRSGEKQDFKPQGPAIFKDLPVVVLVNEGSASASEILAGSLKDNRQVKLVGKHTFGKGTVQEVVALSDGSSLKITVAHWLLPSGKVIEKNGLNVDYEIDLTEDDIKNNRDPQLDKAIEIAKEEINNNSFKTLFDFLKAPIKFIGL